MSSSHHLGDKKHDRYHVGKAGKSTQRSAHVLSRCSTDTRFSGERFLSARGRPRALGFTFRQLSCVKDSNIARGRELPIDSALKEIPAQSSFLLRAHQLSPGQEMPQNCPYLARDKSNTNTHSTVCVQDRPRASRKGSFSIYLRMTEIT